MYNLISPLVTTYQLDIEDFELTGKITKKNLRKIYEVIDKHNDDLRILAIALKAAYELEKKVNRDKPIEL
jgi:hypothetical protein